MCKWCVSVYACLTFQQRPTAVCSGKIFCLQEIACETIAHCFVFVYQFVTKYKVKKNKYKMKIKGKG